MSDLVLPGNVSVEEWIASRNGGPLLPDTLTREQWNAYQRMLDSQFFLVRNRAEHGERFRCSRHSFRPGVDEPTYHEYFTVMCIDRPWRGLDGALWAYASITSDDRVKSMVMNNLPALQTVHPETYARLQPDSSGEELVAIALGTLEPISESKARQLAARINAARPPRPFIL